MGVQGGDGSGGGDSGGDDISNANLGVPAFSRKVVQSLKEIVNCSDLEIYAMLVDCNMDPNETVNRLLSQDTFHEVKSKRYKKKETKDPTYSWKHSIPNRRAISSGNDSYKTTRGGGKRFNSNEMGSVQGVSANRRENETRNRWTRSSSTSGHQPPSNSDLTNNEVKKAPTGLRDVVSSSLLPSHAYQYAWSGANLGQRTMADIVKMGKPQESGSKSHLKNEWPSIEKQDVSYPSSSFLKPSPESEMSADQFSESQHLNEIHLDDEDYKTKTNPIVSPPYADLVSSLPVSSRNLLDDDSRDSSLYDDDENNKAEQHDFEENGSEDVYASIATGFHQLIIDNEEDHEALPKKDKHAVMIPDHIQVHSSEYSNMMFGSFGSEKGSCQDIGLNDNLEKTQETEDDSSFRHLDNDFYGDGEEQLRNVLTDEHSYYQIDSTARNYHASSDSEPEVSQHEPPDADYRFENSQQLNPPSETNHQMHNLYTFPNVMQQGYMSSLPNILLPSCIQDARELYLHYVPFPTRYNITTSSSLSNPAISIAEALRDESISPQNTMSGAGQQASALSQHLAMNPYSHQHGMPLGHYGNLIRYPLMPPGYNPYMATAFQPVFPAGNHQDVAGMHPQYITQSTAPPFLCPPSAYGFGGGASSSNNYSLNPTNAGNSYEDVLKLQYNESNHLVSSLQHQNENSLAWHQRQHLISRVVLENGYYSFPRQHDQQLPDFPQSQQLHHQQQQQLQQQQLQQQLQQQQLQQQLQQHQQLQQQQPSQQQPQHQFIGHDYVSPYHSQARMSLDYLHHQHQQHHQQQQQQQNARDPSRQEEQHLWPNNY